MTLSMATATISATITATTNTAIKSVARITVMYGGHLMNSNNIASKRDMKRRRRRRRRMQQRRPILDSGNSDPTIAKNDDDELFTYAVNLSEDEDEREEGSSGYGTYKKSSNKYDSGGGGGASIGSGYASPSGASSPSSSSSSYSSSLGAATSSSYNDGGYSSSRYKSPPASSPSSSYSSTATTKSKFTTYKQLPTITISVIPAILFLLLLTLGMMLLTAHRMEHYPEGNFANCCRVLLHSVSCFSRLLYNLYYGRWGDIVHRMATLGDEDDDTMEDYTDEEMERMKLRPGIERALDVEHSKALRRVGIEMEKISKIKAKTKLGKMPPRK